VRIIPASQNKFVINILAQSLSHVVAIAVLGRLTLAKTWRRLSCLSFKVSK